MKGFRNEIKHIFKTVTVLIALFAMTFVLAGSVSAEVIGPFGNSTVVQAPSGAAVSPFGVRSAILKSSDNEFFRPNPFFQQNAFFRPSPFLNQNLFFRPNPFLNPFFGDDLDDFGVRERFGDDD
ncbi:MAG: hypothetical protein H7Y05_01310 [Steroidobacteraceae bacterium]|nr:hypothetical protein [Deltaproteobacteria bacterium]